jgi:hypothetical protein
LIVKADRFFVLEPRDRVGHHLFGVA